MALLVLMLENPQAITVFKANGGEDIVRLSQLASMEMTPQTREYLQQVEIECNHHPDEAALLQASQELGEFCADRSC